MKKSSIAIISGSVGGMISFGLTIGLMSLPISADLKKSLDPCPYLFQEIQLLEMIPEFQTAEKKAIDKHWNLLEEYVGKKCPSYEGLDLQLTNHRQRLGILGPTESISSTSSLAGNLVVYILPYPAESKYQVNASEVYELTRSLVKKDFRSAEALGASKSGQYDNDGNILKPSESVKFSIHHDVKKSDGKTLTIDDISENMLFGNGITIGGVLLKNESTVDATIIVVDSSFESEMNPIIDQLSRLLTEQKTWVEINPIQCAGNPWEQDWIKSHPDDYFVYARVISKEKIDIITSYYKKLGIMIFDAKLVPWDNMVVCESCSCPIGYTQSLLVSNSDVDKMLEFGYKISENQ